MDRKTYTFDEAFKASLDYFTGDELAAKVWVNKYALKDAFGNIYEESPNDMHHRLASEIARVEKKYPNPLSEQELFDLFDHFRYIVPQGSPMTGIGNDYQIASLSNCFVIGLDGQADSYGAIIRIDEEQVQLMKRRGGVGHDLSHIRPKGSPVKNSALTSTGLVPFMERYSNSTREVAQDGRRGALMLSVSIKHPDSEAFIDAKMTEGKVTGANVSVKIDDDFMNAAVNGGTYKQQYPIDSDSPVYVKDIDASGLWKKIIHNAWKSAEPGVLFWDTILRESVPDCYADLGFRTVSTNPCGEIPLCPYDSCRLLAINLYSYVVNPFINRLREADPALYEDMLKYGRRNIACLTIAPTGTTSLMTQTTSGIEPVFLPVYKRRRKVNPNDSEARVDFVDETGDAFEEYIVFHHKFVTWMQANGYSASKKYTQEEVEELVAKSPYYKATSNDVDWLQKVRMQGRIQKWVDHSISVTINLPNDVSEELVDSLYVEAWRCGCKGCTVYRDGSRSGVLIATDKKKKKEDCNCMQPPVIVSTRPRELDADVVKFQNNREKWIAFVGLLNGRPYEIFTGLADDDEGIMLPKNVSKGTIIKSYDEDGNKHYDFQFKNKRGYKMTIEGLDGKFNPEYWNYAKLISGVLRYGMPIDQVIKLVQGMELNSESINTWKNGVERALKKYLPNGMEAKGQKCPNCGLETLIYQEGCLICTNCGASKCG